MAIIKTSRDFSSPTASSKETYFEGRVLKVEITTETRNWSPTLDYTDYRTTACTYALVWLGTHNLPPQVYNNSERPVVESDLLQSKIASYKVDKVRDLEFFEQFAWVDCTNIFSDRYGFRLSYEVDSSFADSHKEPLMWANYVAWEAFHKERAARKASEIAARAEERRIAEQTIAAKKSAATAARAATDEVKKAEAERTLTAAPAKGTTVTVGGFTGIITWKGIKKFYGKWRARVGIKNTTGEMIWVDADKVSA